MNKQFSIRMIFRHGDKNNCANGLYEERLMLYQATSADSALAMAEKTISRYLSLNENFKQVGDLRVFELSESIDAGGGLEVWSQALEGPMETAEFYKNRYKDFEY